MNKLSEVAQIDGGGSNTMSEANQLCHPVKGQMMNDELGATWVSLSRTNSHISQGVTNVGVDFSADSGC